MASPVTKTDIVNAAAALLGSSERVSSIDDPGQLALHARAVWDLTIRGLLADHPWNFAIERAALNEAIVPTHGYTRGFALPADALRLLSWGDAEGYHSIGEIEGGHLLTSEVGPLTVRYLSTRHIDDAGRWPPHFADAAVARLAARLAEPLTGKQGLRRDMEEKADTLLSRARRVDGLESQHGRRGAVNARSRWLRGSHRRYYGPYHDGEF